MVSSKLEIFIPINGRAECFFLVLIPFVHVHDFQILSLPTILQEEVQVRYGSIFLSEYRLGRCAVDVFPPNID